MVRLSFIAIFRLVIFFVVTQPGRILAGILLIIGALIGGLTSHNVDYQHSTESRYHLYPFDDGVDYLQSVRDLNEYYIINEADFKPYPASDYANKEVASLVFSSDTTPVDVALTDGTKLLGIGHQVVHFALVDTTSNGEQSYSTDDYQAHPGGYNDNHWPWAGALGLLGLLFLAVALVIRLLPVRQLKEERVPDLIKHSDPWVNNQGIWKISNAPKDWAP